MKIVLSPVLNCPKSIMLILMLISCNIVVAQKQFKALNQYESDLKLLYDSLFASDGTKFYQPDSIKNQINSEIIDIFNLALQEPKVFDYSFSKLDHIGEIKSKNKLLKVITWNIQYSDGTYKYFGYLLYQQKKKKPLIVYKLEDKSELIKNPANAVLSDTNWYGALYYKIVDVKHNGKTYYTLLGWDGFDYFSTKKVVDILYFTRKGIPVFGKEMFKFDKTISTRLIFQYSEKSVMSLSYDENLKMIIYDYLVPPGPAYKGKFQFYGPDGSYDGLNFNGGKWVHYSDIDIKLLKNMQYRSGKPKKGAYQPKRIYP